jgi:hypothetical protein
MEYFIGLGLAVVVCALAMLLGFDRDRVFYPTLVIVVAHYYILFAVMGSSTRGLVLESLIAAVFFVLAMAVSKEYLVDCGCPGGTRSFRLFHQVFIRNPGVFSFAIRASPLGGPASAFRSTFSPAVSSPFY